MNMKLGPGEPPLGPWRVVPIEDVVRIIYDAERMPHDRPWILAVDGRGAGGKSTLADVLHHAFPASTIVHTDDIAWHHSFFDWSELLIEHMLKPLRNGEAVTYQPPGWKAKGRPGAIKIAAGLDLIIVEGVGGSRTEVMPWIDRSIWVQSDFDEAERRGISRDGASRGMTMVEGTINGFRFQAPLEPDGKGSHWYRIDQAILKEAHVNAGDTVSLEIEPSEKWPEPELPEDVKDALQSAPQAHALWMKITPNAQWDWIRWIRATKQQETRKRRIETACSKLEAGERRPCCFNRTVCTEPSVSNHGVLLEPTQTTEKSQV